MAGAVRALRVLAWLALSVLVAPGWAPARAEARRNVILMIADGFGPQHFEATWLFSERVLHRPLCMAEVMRRGATGVMVNDTADAVVTESAAAATQMATGRRATARVLSISPDPAPAGTPFETILELAQKRAMRTGLVTTSGITDATPGAFAAHVLDRGAEGEVAAQELSHGVDVLMGGRKEFFQPRWASGSARKDERDLLDEAREAGYSVVENEEQLERVAGGKVLGLFSHGNMAYELERAGSGQPSLAAMTSKALALLSGGRGGFFAMIEGGRIDHAAHSNDAATAIREGVAFDEAVCRALEFQRRHPETLLVVTSDHETGGMALIGNGKESAGKSYLGIDLQAIARARVSLETLVGQLGETPSAARVQEKVRDGLGIELTEAEAQAVLDDPIHALDPANYGGKRIHSLAFVLRPYLRVAFSTQTHTASPLFVYGLGPGSRRLVGFHHNTDLFEVMKAALPGR
jgi:alkaline phosphatase